MTKAIVAFWLFLALPVTLSSAALAHDTAADQAEIKQLMRKTWERPDAPLSVEPIVVIEDYAIAGWVQGDRGGRALLRKVHQAWDVVLCSGDHLRSADTVQSTGATAELARRLVAQLLDAESRIAPAVLAKFSSFDGVVLMDSAKSHGRHP